MAAWTWARESEIALDLGGVFSAVKGVDDRIERDVRIADTHHARGVHANRFWNCADY